MTSRAPKSGAFHTRIFIMYAIVIAPGVLTAVPQTVLCAPTIHIVQPDVPRATSIAAKCSPSGVTEHATEDSRIIIIPIIITNCPPLIVIVNFSSASVGATHDPDALERFAFLTLFSLLSLLARRPFHPRVSLLTDSSRFSFGTCQPRASSVSLSAYKTWDS